MALNGATCATTEDVTLVNVLSSVNRTRLSYNVPTCSFPSVPKAALVGAAISRVRTSVLKAIGDDAR